jgi:hypothetical protein
LDPELLRLRFPDQGALEREIAANLRYGRVFVSKLLEFPMLTHGVVVIVHPVTQHELRLPAQIVMVNNDGPMFGTGLALRAFGQPEIEQLEAFARETGPAAPVRMARSAAAESQRNMPAASAAREKERPRSPSSAVNVGVGRAAREVQAAPAPARPHSASSAANRAVQRPAQEINRPGSISQPIAARPRTASSATIPAVRQPVPPTAAEPARKVSGTGHWAVSRPVAEDDWSDFEHGPAAVPPAQPAAKAADTNAGFVQEAPTAKSAAVLPAVKVPQAKPREPIVMKKLGPAVAEDDWSDFEHGPEPSTAAKPAATPPRAAAAEQPALEPENEDGFTISYEPGSPSDPPPSPSFATHPHEAVTRRPPPPKDGSDP